MDGESGELRE